MNSINSINSINSNNNKCILLKISGIAKKFDKEEVCYALNFLCVSEIVEQYYTSDGKKNGCNRISRYVRDGFGEVRNITCINNNKTFIISILEKNWNNKDRYTVKALNDMRNGTSIQICDSDGELLDVSIRDMEDPIGLF